MSAMLRCMIKVARNGPAASRALFSASAMSEASGMRIVPCKPLERFSSTAESPLPESEFSQSRALEGLTQERQPEAQQEPVGGKNGKARSGSKAKRKSAKPGTDEQLIAQLNDTQSPDDLMRLMRGAMDRRAELSQPGPTQEAVLAYFEAVSRASSNSMEVKTARPDSIWHIITKLLDFVPDDETLIAVARLAATANLTEKELSAILTEIQARHLTLDWTAFMGLFRAAEQLEAASIVGRLAVFLASNQIPIENAGETDLEDIAVASVRAAAAQKNAHKALQLVEEAKRLSPVAKLDLYCLQEILQGTIERGDTEAVERALELMKAAAANQMGALRMDEGQLLSLLNFTVSRYSFALGQAAWDLYQQALRPANEDAQGSKPAARRFPLPEAYCAMIHLYGKFNRFSEAFAILGELQEAYPDLDVAWHTGLISLVDCLSGDEHNIRAAQKIIEERLSKGELVTTAMTDCVLAAAGQINEIELAFQLFDAFSADLPPTSDTYAAILKGCISGGVLESVPLIVQEIASKELPLTRQLMSLFVYFHIVARNCQGVLTMLQDMQAQGFEPSQELLEMALKRMEREGHQQGIDILVGQMGRRNWKMHSAHNVRKRWRGVGGMEYLTGSRNFVPRPEPYIDTYSQSRRDVWQDRPSRGQPA